MEPFVSSDIDAICDYCVYWGEHRHDLPFDIDGMVVKVNSLADNIVADPNILFTNKIFIVQRNTADGTACQKNRLQI